MFLLTALTAVVLVGCALGQATKRDTPNKRLSDQEGELQPQFNTTYYVAVADSPPIPQLFISDEEALQLCQPYARGHSFISVSHPRTCSARVLCTRQKKNPFIANTVYRIIAYVFTMAQGTFWSGTTRTLTSMSTDNDCASDPCKTGKDMTDGRFCFTFLTCQRDGEVMTYAERECPAGQSFNANTGTCQVDDTCKRPIPGDRYTNLYCNATKPDVLIPGTQDDSYFNRTFRNNDNGTVETVSEYCPGSLVFDTRRPEDCKCVPKTELSPAVPDLCPKTLLEINSQKSANWNNAPGQDGRYSVSTNPRYSGWARFESTMMSFYSAGVLNNNELTYDFTLSFEFALDGLPNGQVALVSNSLNSNTCPVATVQVYLDTSRAVVAEMTNVNGERATVRSSAVDPTSPVSVRVRREGASLKLSVNGGQEVTSSDSLGSLRLKSTNCGLVLAKSNGLQSLKGWMDKVLLISDCIPTEN